MNTNTSRPASGTEHEIGIIPDRFATNGGFTAVCELHDWHGPTRTNHDQAADDAARHDARPNAHTPHYPHFSGGVCEEAYCTTQAGYDGHTMWATADEFDADHHSDHSICYSRYGIDCDHTDHQRALILAGA